jgi:hypothetical protein
MVALDASNTTTEMDPASGMDFAFDSVATSNDFWSASAMQRSIRLPPGTYRIFVQRAVTNAATVFRLDDWDFQLDVTQ